MSKEIRLLPTKSRSKKIDPLQGVLDLRVDRETEIQGIGMGVLSDGTPFLTQRGLAHLCGVRNAHIGGISVEWNEIPQKPRISRIRDSLSSRGVTSKALLGDEPFMQEFADPSLIGQTLHKPGWTPGWVVLCFPHRS